MAGYCIAYNVYKSRTGYMYVDDMPERSEGAEDIEVRVSSRCRVAGCCIANHVYESRTVYIFVDDRPASREGEKKRRIV